MVCATEAWHGLCQSLPPSCGTGLHTFTRAFGGFPQEEADHMNTPHQTNLETNVLTIVLQCRLACPEADCSQVLHHYHACLLAPSIQSDGVTVAGHNLLKQHNSTL